MNRLNKIGRSNKMSSPSMPMPLSAYWTTRFRSAKIEPDSLADLIVTFSLAKTVLTASDFSVSVNGSARGINSATWVGAILTIVLVSGVNIGDAVLLTFNKTGQSSPVIVNTSDLSEITSDTELITSDTY